MIIQASVPIVAYADSHVSDVAFSDVCQSVYVESDSIYLE
jgi:hypothetical protein